jgi:hypothetical protein
MGKPLKPQMVVVTWVDAQDLPEHWVEVGKHDQEPAVVKSVGFLIQPDPIKDHVTLAASWGESHYAGGINIPRSCVEKIRRLR